jgi:hypothetical protein
LEEIVERHLQDGDDLYDFADAILNDLDGFRQLAERLDEVNDDGTPIGLLQTFEEVVKNLDDRSFCFIVAEAENPAAYLATLI